MRSAIVGAGATITVCETLSGTGRRVLSLGAHLRVC